MKPNTTLIKNGTLVNEGKIEKSDILIVGNQIQQIKPSIASLHNNTTVIDATGKYIFPGVIDDQVHFREPGLTHKATIATESKAAIAGGITSYIEMPNTKPQTTTIAALNEKFKLAAASSYANYSFMFGGTNDNIEEIKKLDKNKVAALKLFLGSSTGNMLVDNPETLREIFSSTKLVIAVHCEDEATIQNNLKQYTQKYGDAIPIACHPEIRSAEACYLSSSKAIQLAKETGARLHVFHVSTAKETHLFTNTIPLEEKQITAEVCIHHLWFTDTDYTTKGTHIKWNPAVKTKNDQDALWQALLDDRIDVVATDHAPHTRAEKDNLYTKAPSGGPLVQHALPAMLEMYHTGKISLEKIVEKMCHNPAILFQIEKRGYLREGYFADLVIVDLEQPWQVTKNSILYKCQWSPFTGTTFQSKIISTFVNGSLVYNNSKFKANRAAMQLTFNR